MTEVIKGLTQADLDAFLRALDKSVLASLTDARGSIIYANEKFVEVSKYSLQELIGQNHRILKSGLQPQAMFDEMWKTISAGDVWRGEIQNRAKDGSYYWVDTTIAPILGKEGKPERYVSIRVLITEKKLAEEAQRAQNLELQQTKIAMLSVLEDIEQEKIHAEKLSSDLEKFKLAVDSANDQVIITDENGTVLYANKAMEQITGFKIEETIGKKAGSRDLWGGLMPKEFYENMWKTIKTDKMVFTGQIKNHRRNGEEYYAKGNISPVLGTSGNVEFFVAIEHDSTDEKKGEEAQARDEAILASALEGVVVVDNMGKFVFFNEQARALLGRGPMDVPPQEWAKTYGVTHLTQDRILEMSEIKVFGAMNGEKITGEKIRIKRPDESYITVRVNASPVISEGKAIGVVFIFFDISKEEEVDKAKTEFVSLASHQLRTPLSSINWYSEMLLSGDAGQLNEEQKKYLGEVYAGSRRMVDLVDSLLNVSRIELGTFSVEPTPTDLAALSASVIKEQKQDVDARHIALKVDIATDIPLVPTDPRLVRMVMQNLLSNAVKYTPEGGNVQYSLKREGEHVALTVSDSGWGVPLAQQDKLFTKLFRADNVRAHDTQGTGLGLYIVKSIVDSAGGKISFESQENKGTTFHVTFPLAGMTAKTGNTHLGS